VITSFLFESLLIALVGGIVGCIAVLPVNGLTTGTMNWQTFSHLRSRSASRRCCSGSASCSRC
jgi:ABC-type antimicrobial peptide transport system permease subunit